MAAADSALFAELLDEVVACPTRGAVRAALAAHECHRSGPYGDVVGALAIDAGELDTLAGLVAAGAARPPLGISLGVRRPVQLAAAVAAADAIPGVRIERVLVDVPTEMSAAAVVRLIRRELRDRILPYALRLAGPVTTSVDGAPSELATALTNLVPAGVPVEVGGVDRALADVDAAPWAVRTGALNVLLAADAARDGAEVEEVQQILMVADGLLEAVLLLEPEVRRSLRAIATTHVDDIVDDLTRLGLLVTPQPGFVAG